MSSTYRVRLVLSSNRIENLTRCRLVCLVMITSIVITCISSFTSATESSQALISAARSKNTIKIQAQKDTFVSFFTYVAANSSVQNSSDSDNTIENQARDLTTFDISLMVDGAGSVPQSINEIIEELGSLEQDYIDSLQERRSSYGLFAIGQYDDDIQNNEIRYRAGIKWKIFNDGYYESVRRDTKKILQTRLEFYQLRRDMKERQLEEDLYHLFSTRNFIYRAYYYEKTISLTRLLQKRARQLEHGYTTELDILDIERQLRNASNSLAFYKKSVCTSLSKEQVDMFNSLESVRLKPVAELLELAQSASFELKIQDNFIERSEFFPAWTNDIAVNINAEYKHEFYEKERTVLGIEVEVPLMLDTSRQSLIDIQKRIYRYQTEAINHRLEQRIEKLSSFFSFQQLRLVGQQENIELFIRQLQGNEEKESHIIQQLNDDPARNMDRITMNILDGRYEALHVRLKIYEIMLKLLALTQADSVTALFECEE